MPEYARRTLDSKHCVNQTEPQYLHHSPGIALPPRGQCDVRWISEFPAIAGGDIVYARVQTFANTN